MTDKIPVSRLYHSRDAGIYFTKMKQKIDAVAIIKDRLTMRDVLEHYGFAVKKRIRCPIHDGGDENFEVKEKTFVCHSRCGNGDVITFVQKYFSLSFPEALKKIDTDFSLGIYESKSFEEMLRQRYLQQAINDRRERERREQEKADAEYWAAFDEWKRLDDNRRKYKPKSPDEELHPLFLETLQKLEHQKAVLSELEEKRNTNV